MPDPLNPLLVRIVCGFCLVALLMGLPDLASGTLAAGMLVLVALHRPRP